MSGRKAREARQHATPTAAVPPPATEPPPPPPAPETISTVINAVGALEKMGDAAFEKLLAGYGPVASAKGETFAYAWLAWNLERHAGPGAVRAIAAAGVLHAHRSREADAWAAAGKALRVEWLNWAIGQMTGRLVAACTGPSHVPHYTSGAMRRTLALRRLVDALAREAS